MPARQPPEFELSKSAVDRAGQALRDWWLADDETPPPAETVDILFAFRAAVQDPLKKVTVGLRQFVVREAGPDEQIAVGQRLKRAPQTVLKLTRHPGMRLSRMQDIGGCRAILAGGHDEVRRVAARIEHNWIIKHRRHYTLDDPAPSGYRALHIVVERDGRLVEIQLRTPGEHEWAEAVERTDKRLGFDLKGGHGPRRLLDYFRLASDGLAMSDAGIQPQPDFLRDFEQARAAARPFFRRS